MPHGSPRRARRGAEHGRRCRHPHGVAARVSREGREAASSASTLPAAGQVRGRHRVPADRRGRARALQGVRRADLRRGRPEAASAGGSCRRGPTRPTSAIGARAAMPQIEQLFVAAGDGVEGDAFERKLYLIRKRASHQLRGDTTLRQAKLFYVCSLSSKIAHLQGHADAGSAARTSIPTSTTRTTRRISRWCIRGSRRTRSRAGTARSRTASCRTTARSTRCAATRTGCARARASSRASSSATRCRSCSRSSSPTARTPACSTTCSSSC